jgi:hypothetical protein
MPPGGLVNGGRETLIPGRAASFLKRSIEEQSRACYK